MVSLDYRWCEGCKFKDLNPNKACGQLTSEERVLMLMFETCGKWEEED